MRASQWKIFYRGSVTYFFSSLLFPRTIRDKVGTLYAFVRTADDLVDTIPPHTEAFYAFKNITLSGKPSLTSKNQIIANYLALAHECSFDPLWTRSFLDAMESDINHKPCTTMKETIAYMYGSAEVIGLMMGRIMNLPDKALPFAQLLGRSMQYINFIRDVAEDNSLGRQYLPRELLSPYGLSDTSYASAQKSPDAWRACIIEALDTYRIWQQEAERGYEYIPWKLLSPIKTAADMYTWTAQEIAKDPLVVFHHKIKPHPLFVLKTGIRNAMYLSTMHPTPTI